MDLPAWHTIFFCNLADLFRPGRQAPFESSSPPGSFWPDVFVTSRLPWSRFGLSVLGHVAAIAAILASAQFWPQSPAVVVRQAFNRNDVIYYAPSEYLPPLDTGGTRKPSPEKGDPAYAPQPIISVPPEADNRSQTIVTPSDIKLNHDVPLPNIVAWSQNPAQPSIPLASMAATATNFRVPTLLSPVVAPAPETIPTARQRSPSLSQAVVAPAPDLDVQSSARTLQAPQAAIVEPAPRIDSTSGRRLGDLNIGHSAVVAPAPELPVSEQYADQHAGAGRTQPAMGGAGPRSCRRHPRLPATAVRRQVVVSSHSAFSQQPCAKRREFPREIVAALLLRHRPVKPGRQERLIFRQAPVQAAGVARLRAKILALLPASASAQRRTRGRPQQWPGRVRVPAAEEVPDRRNLRVGRRWLRTQLRHGLLRLPRLQPPQSLRTRSRMWITGFSAIESFMP